METKIFEVLSALETKLNGIDKKLSSLEEKMDLSISIQRNHLIRVKNNEFIPDDMILLGRPYNDMQPEKAFKIYSNPDLDFILIDVSRDGFAKTIDGSIKIPLEDLETRYNEIYSKTTPILIVSEKGIRSIQACEYLIKKGYFNINNISGGHQYWPGHRIETNSKPGQAV